MPKPLRHLAAVLALAACASEPAPLPPAEPLVLTGTITRADHQTYREIPFTVPPGTGRITVDFTYDKENRTVIDLGLRDPNGQRGWSGGNKSSFHVGWDPALRLFASSPSYTWGMIEPGEWRLVLGVPNIREGQASAYSATITLSPAESKSHGGPVYTPQTVATGSRWYRGDFHTHTAHSDGACDVVGERRPCPASNTAKAAHDAGLDFVAITDHNTISQLLDITVQQGRHQGLLLIPGTEITTFNGHANVIGNTGFLDFQLGSPRLPTLAKLFDQVDAASAFISVNHPSLPSGEACMGCGWTVKDTDWSRVTAIEVINGASMRTSGPEGAFNGIAFWDKLLRDGHRITAIAGSDNHDATDTTGAKQSPVGRPATVVYANELSTDGIIAGVKSGRAFIDVASLPDVTLDIVAVNVEPNIAMGGEVRVATGRNVTLDVRTTNLPDGARVESVFHGLDVTPRVSSNPDWYTSFVSLQPGRDFGWFRANVRDASGKLLLLGNPIYFRRAG